MPVSDAFGLAVQAAIVTGESQNIGEAIAMTFAGTGVMIADRDGDKAVAIGRPVPGVACAVPVAAGTSANLASLPARFDEPTASVRVREP